MNRKNAGSGQKTEVHRSSFPGLKTVTSAVPPVAAYVPCIGFGRRGITHLKLVGRGNYADYMERDICNLKRALTLLEESGSETDYREKMKRELFPKGCSGNCYYRE